MTSDPVEANLIGDPTLYFSYGQFMAYDRDENQPGSIWTDDHVRQGFVRRPHSICFGTLVSHGQAELRILLGTPSDIHLYERVVCVPIELPSGELRLEDPEEYPINRMVHISPGCYQLYVAQRAIDDDTLQMDLFVSSISGDPVGSIILRADEQLHSHGDLVETGDVAK